MNEEPTWPDEVLPFALRHLVPEPLKDILLEVAWDQEKLHALPLPVEDVPLEELRWQLELPWWRDGERYFAASPNQVRTFPARYPEEFERMQRADPSFPVHLLERKRWVMLDGMHRLLKADMLGRSHIRACRVPAEHFRRVLRLRSSAP